MREILLDLNKASEHIEASALLSSDGIVIASALPQEMNEDTIGALSAALLSVSSHCSRELADGSLEQVIVKSAHGYILVNQTSQDTLLSVITRSHEDLQHINSEIQRSSDKIIAQLSAL